MALNDTDGGQEYIKASATYHTIRDLGALHITSLTLKVAPRVLNVQHNLRRLLLLLKVLHHYSSLHSAHLYMRIPKLDVNTASIILGRSDLQQFSH